MKDLNAKDGSKKTDISRTSKQSQINQVRSKGKTLGAQHASHGDAGIDRSAKKVSKQDWSQSIS